MENKRNPTQIPIRAFLSRQNEKCTSIYKSIYLGRWIIGVSCIFMYTKGYAEEGKLYEEQIVVEHAEIVIPALGRDKMSGYFSIWNGTDEYLWIKGFESIQFATITLDEPTGVNGKYVSKPEPIPKALPPKNELVMSKGGVPLSINYVENLIGGDQFLSLFIHKQDAIRCLQSPASAEFRQTYQETHEIRGCYGRKNQNSSNRQLCLP